ncbi:helix-turn-helix domain-containing protein [Actinoplanes sp. NPDC026619]|uniref:nSTAND1 domain-containing NTPase n=1 Tax=Actinoplanes sp. NPDC026619 TaxID=3155798 RepID=UPI003409C3EE
MAGRLTYRGRGVTALASVVRRGAATSERGRPISDTTETEPDRIESRDELGAGLTTLRLRAGLTIRELASRAGLPTATVGDYVKGRHLPGPAQSAQFRKLLEASGVSDPDELARWQDALNRVRASTDGRQSRRGPDGAPYPGLRPFEAADAALFFGREAFLAAVLERLSALLESDISHKLLFVVGASGSGKSSLLRAGVQPAVLDGALGDSWSVAIMVPGTDPVAALEQALAGAEEPRLLIVDQFEELYTEAGADEDFVAALAGLGPQTLVLAGMRADFFPRAAADPHLVPALQGWQMVVPPLTEQELRSAITDPADAWQVTVDEALVEVLLAEILPVRRPENALPLLSHALLTAWGQRTKGRLTLNHYRAAGGLGGAVQQSAEQAYAELSAEEQELARRLFLRLVTIDDDHVTTKRRITRSELPASGDDVEPVIERFVARRLITVDEHNLEISHDALLTAWPRLADWIAADHAGLLLHRRLTGAAKAWQEESADDLLMRGNILSDVTEWAGDADHRASMNALELDYLDRSAAARDAEQRVERRRIVVLRRLVAALMVLVVVSAGSAGYAFRASHVAATQRKAADVARDEALSRQVAIESTRAAEFDPALAEQLALTAYRISPTVDARSALFDAISDGYVHRLVGASGPTMLRINPDANLVAISNAKDGSVDLRRYANGRPGDKVATVPAASPGKSVFALAFSPDGNVLAIGGEGGVVHLVDVHDPARPEAVADAPGTQDAVESIAFSPDGNRLVAAGTNPALRAWSWTAGAWKEQPIKGGATVMQTVAFSPDGRTLVGGGTDGKVVFWAPDHLGTAPVAVPIAGTTVNVTGWSPDGRSLVAGAKDGTASIIDVATRKVRAKLDTGFTSWVNAVAYSPAGDLLAVGGSNNTIAVFDVKTNARLATVASAAQVTAIAYAPDGKQLNVAAADGTVRTFPVLPRSVDPGSGALFALGIDHSGQRLAVASTGPAGQVSLWSLTGATPQRQASPANPASFGASAGSVAISADGTKYATGNRAGQVLLVAAGKSVVLTGATALIESVQFNPAGNLVAASSDDGFVHVWDVTDPAAPRALPKLDSGGLASSIAFSPDGRYLAAGSVDRTVHWWNVANPAAAEEMPALSGFDNYAFSVTFSPDSRTIAAGGADDTIRLWDITDPRLPTPKGTMLTGPTHYVFSLAFSPDGKTLAGSGGDGSVWTWKLGAGGAAQTRTALHAANSNGKTYAIAYTPDGSTLLAVGSLGRVTQWPTDEQQVVTSLCTSGGDPLTTSEWAKYVPGVAYRAVCP